MGQLEVNLCDGASGSLATITQFHSADGQSLGTGAYGVYSGVVDQLLNGSGTLDRKRGGYTAVQTSATGFANGIAMGIYNSTLPTFANGNIGPLQQDSNGRLIVALQSTTVGGLSTYRNINLGTTGVNIKASAGQVYGYHLYNNAASVVFVKFYNKATAPTVGTDTPFMTIPLPANSGATVNFVQGVAFGTGIGIGASTGVADSDATAPAANQVIVDVFYA